MIAITRRLKKMEEIEVYENLGNEKMMGRKRRVHRHHSQTIQTNIQQVDTILYYALLLMYLHSAFFKITLYSFQTFG